MGKDKSEKKDKKEKKEKRSEKDGVKKPKKEKKSKLTAENVDAVLQEALKLPDPTSVDEKPVIKADREVKPIPLPIGALVPFAAPLADEKATKKVLKTVKKGKNSSPSPSLYTRKVLYTSASVPNKNEKLTRPPLSPAAKNKTLKRGVKEVVKCLRKSPAGASNSTLGPGVVVLAADISPMDVISHIPVLCEDHNVPYIFVTSRAELGAAGLTKRPTSVVMVSESRSGAKKGEKIEGEDEFGEVYAELVKLVQKENRLVRV